MAKDSPDSPEGGPERRTVADVYRMVGEVIQDFGRKVSDSQNLSGDDALLCNLSNATFSDEIGKGRNGTTAFRGTHRGHHVALITFPPGHVEIDRKVVDVLTKNQHQNVVHNHGLFVYGELELVMQELCLCSLNDVLASLSTSTKFPSDQTSVVEYTRKIKSIMERLRHVQLWIGDEPSWILVKLMRDMVLGVEHLHALGIVHGNLRPENVLIAESNVLLAKISDVGMTKCMHGHRASLGNLAPGHVNSGWQAPELFHQGRYPTSMTDLFSLGCIFFTCLTRGHHPYGGNLLERDQNIKTGKKKLSLVMMNREGYHLIKKLLENRPADRGTATEVVMHPFFWCPESRMEFFRHMSDRAQHLKIHDPNSDFLSSLEDNCQVICGGNWKNRVDSIILKNLKGNFNENSVVDLLRAIRNVWVHRYQLPADVQELFKTIPVGFQMYFADKFPALLMEMYAVAMKFCLGVEPFVRYFKRDASSCSQLWNLQLWNLGNDQLV